MKIILASGSPRRKEILTEFGYEFIVEKSSFAEIDGSKDAVSVAVNNAEGKAYDIFLRFADKSEVVVIGADTVVCLGEKILGKPKDRLGAVNMLKTLSGKEHKVITGYCVLGENLRIVDFDETVVLFNDLSDKTIEEYVDKCKPFDKAGSYGIQDDFPLVKNIKGSLYNVIGFPIEKIKPILDALMKR